MTLIFPTDNVFFFIYYFLIYQEYMQICFVCVWVDVGG